MESAMSDITGKGSEKLEQIPKKEGEIEEQSKDTDVVETENKNLGKTVGEVTSTEKHFDSPCPMVVEEAIPFPSQTDKEDDLPSMDTETTCEGKKSQSEENSHLSSSPSVDPDPAKGLVDPTMEPLLEHNEMGDRLNADISKYEGGEVKAEEDTSVVHEQIATTQDSKLLVDDANGKMGQEQSPQEPVMKSEGDHSTDPVMPDLQAMEDDSDKIDDTNSVNSPNHVRETAMEIDKELHAPVSETVSNPENETSKPDFNPSTSPVKGSDVPVTDILTENDKKPDVLTAGTSKGDNREVCATQETEPPKDTEDEVTIAHNDVHIETNAKKKDESEAPNMKDADNESASLQPNDSVPGILCVVPSDVKSEEGGGDMNNGVHKIDSAPPASGGTMSSKRCFLLDDTSEGNESGSEEDQSAFMNELENFFRERFMEFKPPKFYGEGLNCLKLWRAVTRLGGYDKVTTCKLWRQVGESFRPPKTCTTVSWTFRGFYEKALLEYERHKVNGGELQIPLASHSEPMNIDNQASGSGRARRDAAARAMQGWHSHRNDEVSDPTTIKDKSLVPQQKREKQIGTPGSLKRKRLQPTEQGAKIGPTQGSKPLLDVTVVDAGPPAEWVKINVQRTKDCFEVYALVPGLLREEVRVQSDPAGRLVISGEPENPNNLWGATPFKKIVSLPARIDPHHTSAVVTLNGQLFVRVPLDQSD